MPYRKSPNQRVSFVFFIARVLACALLCSIYNISVRAQSSITHIVGIVQDQARSPISQAEVLLKNQSTRIAEATTDLDGRFKIDAVVTENATLTVRAQGFALFERKLDALKTKLPELVIVLAPAPRSEQV